MMSPMRSSILNTDALLLIRNFFQSVSAFANRPVPEIPISSICVYPYSLVANSSALGQPADRSVVGFEFPDRCIHSTTEVGYDFGMVG